MNIFEYLGLGKTHRKLANKVTQFVKHWDEVVEKHKEGKTFSLQIKKDGVCSLTVIKDGEVTIWSRTGKRFTNTDILIAKIRQFKLGDGVYLGEMIAPNRSLEVMSGAVNPNRVKPLSKDLSTIPYELQMHFFDIVSLTDFIDGYSPASFESRHKILSNRYHKSILAYFGDCTFLDVSVIPYVPVNSEFEINRIFDLLVKDGEEGVVIRDPNADWEAGHKGWRVMKKVRGVDYDLKCIDYEEGTGKYKGKVANLIFAWKDGKTIKAMLGKGWTHEMAAEMFNDMGTVDTVIGSIFQVYALEESSQGKLRLPKVGEKRNDKDESDV